MAGASWTQSISSEDDNTESAERDVDSASNLNLAIPPDAEPVSPPGIESGDAVSVSPPTDRDHLPSSSPVTPPSNSALNHDLNTELISPDESRSSSRQDCNGMDVDDPSLLLSPHTPPLPPKAYEKYVPTDSFKRKAQDEHKRKSKRSKNNDRKESESPKYVV